MTQQNILDVLIVTPERVLFQGKASDVTLPGEAGVFEVLAHHKPILSLLIGGDIIVDDTAFAIKRGVAEVMNNRIQAIVEEEANV